MKIIALIAVCFFSVAICASAQSFEAALSPAISKIVQGDTAVFYVSITPTADYRYSIYLSGTWTGIGGFVRVKPATVNYPYPSVITVRVPTIFDNSKDIDTQKVYVTAQNGALIRTDTATLIIFSPVKSTLQWSESNKPGQVFTIDSQDSIWSTSCSSVGGYNLLAGKNICKGYSPEYPLGKDVPLTRPAKMQMDANDNPWLLNSGKLSTCDCTNGLWNTLNASFPATMNIGITDFYIESPTRIWLTTGQGLIKYEDGQLTILNTQNSSLPCDYLTSIAKLPNGVYLLGASSRPNSCSTQWPLFQGLIQFDGNNKFSKIPINFPTGASQYNNFNTIRKIVVENNKRVWLITGVSGGAYTCSENIQLSLLYGYNLNEGIIPINSNPLNLSSNGGISNAIPDVLVSREGDGVWIATAGFGLVHFNPNDSSYRVFHTGNSGIKDNFCISLDYDSKGNLWISHPREYPTLPAASIYNPTGIQGIAITGVDDESSVVLGSGMDISPMPTGGAFRLSHRLATPGEAKIAVIDVFGRELYAVRRTSDDGVINEAIDLGSVAPGMYYVTLRTTQNTQTAPLVISR